MASLISLLCMTVIMASFGSTLAVQYAVLQFSAGTPGGVRFEQEIGPMYALQVLEQASEFVWNTFKQEETQRKDIDAVNLEVESLSGIAYTENNIIYLNTEYIANFSGDVRIEIMGIIYHEATHVWQWNGNGKAPLGLIEGMADYIRLKANLAPLRWVQKGSGNRWDESYAVTAYFLDYCNELYDGFAAALNLLMKDDYSDQFFVVLLGKTVDELWKDYKEKYGTM
ncbi:hypothetical protein ACHQM5_019894 [Ranunculus cassubicifolius]